jgi:hypothetical protein
MRVLFAALFFATGVTAAQAQLALAVPFELSPAYLGLGNDKMNCELSASLNNRDARRGQEATSSRPFPDCPAR